MNSITTFNYVSKLIRVIEIDEQPWFVAKDVCEVLKINNVSQAMTNLSQDEVRRINRTSHPHLFPVGRGASWLLLISESGLYKLIMRSDKPEARKFQDWVTREVVPAIREDGAYIKGEELVKTSELDEPHRSLS